MFIYKIINVITALLLLLYGPTVEDDSGTVIPLTEAPRAVGIGTIAITMMSVAVGLVIALDVLSYNKTMRRTSYYQAPTGKFGVYKLMQKKSTVKSRSANKVRPTGQKSAKHTAPSVGNKCAGFGGDTNLDAPLTSSMGTVKGPFVALGSARYLMAKHRQNSISAKSIINCCDLDEQFTS